MHDDKRHGQLSHAGGIPVAHVGLDIIEKVVLELMRHFCQAFSEPNSHAWELALERAEIELGAIDGMQIALRTSQLLKAVRRERKSPFAYIDASCEQCTLHILPVELNLLLATRYARQNDMQNFMAECSALVGSGTRPNLCQNAALKLAQSMENIQPIANINATMLPSTSQMVH